ncbi:pyridoxal phosphate phosphatase PHOSPHO2-like [Lineus longissimus]|uniref:pyridoxal phosphate phosphatase PHOSPHO2-like n=1 Tax=Lineus longissimus TaxID=88925 RepID=UPI002B4E7833
MNKLQSVVSPSVFRLSFLTQVLRFDQKPVGNVCHHHRHLFFIKRSSSTMAKAESNNPCKRILMAFDFDHTIIDKNTDLHVVDLAPKGKIPPEVKALYTKDNWTNYMGEIFKYLHKCGTTKDKILQYVGEMTFAPGMTELLQFLEKDNQVFESIVVSDSNSVFIDSILTKAKMLNVFSEVFTNPAWFESDGRLCLDFYHRQDWCDLSTVNLCKGHILCEYIKEHNQKGQVFDTVVYVGDGRNDLCPALRLSERDIVFVRKDHVLDKLLKDESEKSKIKARVVTYETGVEIIDTLQYIMKNTQTTNTVKT